MELRHLFFAERVWVEEGKLCCARIFQWMPISRIPRVEKQTKGALVPLPRFALGIVLQTSPADAPQTQLMLRVVDGSGNVVFGPLPSFVVPAPVRPAEQRPTSISGPVDFEQGTVRLPGPGEYTFEIFAGDQRLGGEILYLV